jgi:hypothetical protein
MTKLICHMHSIEKTLHPSGKRGLVRVCVLCRKEYHKKRFQLIKQDPEL